MTTESGQGGAPMPAVFVLDCDNTLLRNDDVKSAMDARLRTMLGPSLTEEFWRIYDAVREREGLVNIPATFNELRPALTSDSEFEQARAAVMDFPFQDYLYPEALGAIATLTRHGRPVIVSDGDSVYQPRKIERSGLADAVAGAWVVYVHKEDHLDEVMRRWPGGYYVMIDDKARILGETKARQPEHFVTIHVNQGHYAGEVATPPPDISVASIGDVRDLDFAALPSYLHR